MQGGAHGNEIRFTDDAFKVFNGKFVLVFQHADDTAYVQGADDVIDIVPVDRHARMLAVSQQIDDVVY